MSGPPQRYYRQFMAPPANEADQLPAIASIPGAPMPQPVQDEPSTPPPLTHWVRIIIEITCAPEHPGVHGGNGRKFNFYDYIPRDMIGRKLESKNMSWEPASRYFCGIRNRYHNAILNAQTWDCQFCGEVSKHLLMSGMPRLMDERKWFIFAIPICRTVGRCDRNANVLMQKIFDERFPCVPIPDGPCCEVCGFIHNLKLCGRCNTILPITGQFIRETAARQNARSSPKKKVGIDQLQKDDTCKDSLEDG